jgi:hypothetical protein
MNSTMPSAGRGFAAPEAIDRPGRARALAAGLAGQQKCPGGFAVKQGGAIAVDRGKARALPVAHCILVYAQAIGQFLHAVGAMQLHPVRIDAAGGHRLTLAAARRRIDPPSPVCDGQLERFSRPSAIIA